MKGANAMCGTTNKILDRLGWGRVGDDTNGW